MTSKNQTVADISVVIPTYNRETTLVRAINSALEQTLKPTEVIIVDDGSIDNTESVVNNLFEGRVKYFKQDNLGVAAARNAGIRVAKCPLIAFLDSDDYWVPEKFEKQLPSLNDEEVVLSNTNWRWEGEPDGNEFVAADIHLNSEFEVSGRPLEHLSRPRGHRTLIQTCICRRETLERLHGFDESLSITEDNDLFFRMAEIGKFATLADVLLVRTKDQGQENLTNTQSIEWQQENLDNMIKIFRRSIPATSTYPKTARRKINSRLASLLTNRAKLAMQKGETRLARQLSFESMRIANLTSRDFLLSLATFAIPQILNLRT